MSGGADALRGYRFEALALLLHAFEDETWHAVEFEPPDRGVDIRWSVTLGTGPTQTVVTQVKVPKRPISLREVNEELARLINGTPTAHSYHLDVFGPAHADVSKLSQLAQKQLDLDTPLAKKLLARLHPVVVAALAQVRIRLLDADGIEELAASKLQVFLARSHMEELSADRARTTIERFTNVVWQRHAFTRAEFEQELSRLVLATQALHTRSKARELDERLTTLQRARDEVLRTGGDPSEVEREILERRTERRELGLEAGDLVGKHGRFTLIKRLSIGGAATAWMAWDEATRSEVAVTVLHATHMEEESLSRFERVGRAHARLQHPNVARVIELSAPEDSFAFMVTEFIEARSLAEVLRAREAPISTQEIISITTKVARALGHAHSLGLVHGDISSHSIFITATGEPYLMRFEDAEPTSKAAKADQRSDVYSLAMTALDPLSGELSALHRVTALSSRYRDVFRRVIEPNPADRFADAAEFAVALELAHERDETLSGRVSVDNVPATDTVDAAGPITPSSRQSQANLAALERLGKPQLELARLAAVPLALTPNLVGALWLNFKDRTFPPIPWIAIADLLLSPCCIEVGYELFEFDRPTRELLLEGLPAERTKEVAEFLLELFAPQRQSHDLDERDFAIVQEWAAYAVTEPDAAARDLGSTLTTVSGDVSEARRVATIIGDLRRPLGPAHHQLQTFARGVSRWSAGDIEQANQAFAELVDVDAVGPRFVLPRDPSHRINASIDLICSGGDLEIASAIQRGLDASIRVRLSVLPVITKAAVASEVTVVLVSSEFLAHPSDWNRLVSASSRRVFVVSSKCDWAQLPGAANALVLPDRAMPLSQYRDRPGAVARICEAIERTVREEPLPPFQVARLPLAVESRGPSHRKSLLAQLNEAWADPTTRFVAIIGRSGVGKTALVDTWLTQLAPTYGGARQVFCWTFDDGGGVNDFLKSALRVIGVAASRTDRLEAFSEVVAEQPSLVVLDGPKTEVIGARGEARELVETLARSLNGLCVVTVQTLPSWFPTAGTRVIQVEGLLDHHPLKWDDSRIEELYTILTHAYLDEPETRFAGDRVGVDGTAWNSSGSSRERWRALLDQASTEGKVRRLVEAAAADPVIAAYSPALLTILDATLDGPIGGSAVAARGFAYQITQLLARALELLAPATTLESVTVEGSADVDFVMRRKDGREELYQVRLGKRWTWRALEPVLAAFHRVESGPRGAAISKYVLVATGECIPDVAPDDSYPLPLSPIPRDVESRLMRLSREAGPRQLERLRKKVQLEVPALDVDACRQQAIQRLFQLTSEDLATSTHAFEHVYRRAADFSRTRGGRITGDLLRDWVQEGIMVSRAAEGAVDRRLPGDPRGAVEEKSDPILGAAVLYYWACVIGIEQYASLPFRPEFHAESDARAFRDWATSVDGGRVPEQNAFALLGEVPHHKLTEALANLGRSAAVGPRRLYLYATGLGVTSRGETYLLTSDHREGLPLGIKVSGLAEDLVRTGAFEEVVAFFDCGRTPVQFDVRDYSVGTAQARPGGWSFVGYSCAPGADSFVRAGGGVFTEAVLVGLHGDARLPDGRITARSLASFVEDRMAREEDRGQIPEFRFSGPTIDITLVDPPPVDEPQGEEDWQVGETNWNLFD